MPYAHSMYEIEGLPHSMIVGEQYRFVPIVCQNTCGQAVRKIRS